MSASHGGRRAGAGRPPQAELRRENRITLLASDAELAELSAAAGDVPLSTWLRELGLAAARR